MGHHVDGLKFAGGSFSLFPEDKLRELLELAHEHGVYVSTGGWMEHILTQSDPSAVDKYLQKCKDVGYVSLALHPLSMSLIVSPASMSLKSPLGSSPFLMTTGCALSIKFTLTGSRRSPN